MIIMMMMMMLDPCVYLLEIISPYPLVNVYITNWKITMLNGKIHELSMGHFNRKLSVITRG